MGKGNRNRNDRYQDVMNGSGTKIKKGERNWLGTITFSVVALLLVVVLVGTIIGATGIWMRNQKAATTSNFEVNGAMMSYFYGSYYDTWLNNYGYYVTNGFVSLNPQMPLKSQQFGPEGSYDKLFLGDFTGTWYDFFMNGTVNQVKTYLAYCEGALEDNIKLDDEDYDDINEVVENYKTTAQTNGYSLDSYLGLAFGEGVKEGDVRNSLELIQLASKYYEAKSDENEGKITDDDVFNYFQNNLDKFVNAGYLTFKFEESIKEVDPEDYDGGEEDPKYIEDKAKYDEKKAAVDKLAKELSECETPEEFKGYIIEYLFNKEFDTIYKKYKDKLNEADVPNLEELDALKEAMVEELIAELTADEEEEETESEDKKDDDDDDSETITLDDLKKGVKADIKKKIESGMSTVENENYNFNIEKELGQWIFGGVYVQFDINPDDLETETEDTTTTTTGDAATKVELSGVNAAVNETKIIVDKTSEKYTANVYMVTKEADRDEYDTKDVGHILVSIEKAGTTATDKEKAAAKKKAEDLLAEYLAGDKTKDAFEAIAEKNTADSSVFYENVEKDQMVEEFNDWIYDEARAAGDTGIVETTYGYHVMYFVGDGLTAWYSGAKDGQLDKVNEKFFEEIRNKYEVTIDENVLKNIGA